MINAIQKAWRDGACGPDGDIRLTGKEISYEAAFDAGMIVGQSAERLRCVLIARTLKTGPIYWVDGRPNARGVIGGDLIAEAIENPTDEAEGCHQKPNCTFMAFKASGKMYSSERGILPESIFQPYLKDPLRRILEQNEGKWPGLSGQGDAFIRVICLDDDVKYGFPFLIHAGA